MCRCLSRDHRQANSINWPTESKLLSDWCALFFGLIKTVPWEQGTPHHAAPFKKKIIIYARLCPSILSVVLCCTVHIWSSWQVLVPISWALKLWQNIHRTHPFRRWSPFPDRCGALSRASSLILISFCGERLSFSLREQVYFPANEIVARTNGVLRPVS